MSQTTFLLLPGAWHTPSSYSPLSDHLTRQGYQVQTLSLPTVGTTLPPYSFSDDVSAIRTAVTELVNQGRDIVLVMHSYSGMPGSEALQGLGLHERKAHGLRGGVTRLVYIMAFIVPEGYQMVPTGQTKGLAGYATIDTNNGVSTVSTANGMRVFYNDLQPSEAAHWASEMQPSSLSMFWSRTTYAAWRDIPSTFVLCERDMAFPITVVEAMLNNAKSEDKNMIDTVERVDAGHFPWLGRENLIVDILRKAAGENVKEDDI